MRWKLKKVRDREDALASTRDARAPRRGRTTRTEKGTARYRSLSVALLNDYCKETSSIRKVVDNEKSVVTRYCSRIV